MRIAVGSCTIPIEGRVSRNSTVSPAIAINQIAIALETIARKMPAAARLAATAYNARSERGGAHTGAYSPATGGFSRPGDE